MAELHVGATLTPGKVDLVEAWIGRQRWYAAKGSTPHLRRVAAFRFDDPAGEVGIETLLLADDSGPLPVLYQVPLTYRGTPLAGAEHALVGTSEHSVLGPRWVYDGPHDPVYAAQLLACLQGRARAASSRASGAVEESVAAERHPTWAEDVEVRAARVLTGEQSNTSVILDAVLDDGSPRPLIAKVFRALQPGSNPDVELQGALFEAGCTRVPQPVGHLAYAWPVDETGSPLENGQGTAYGDIALAQEFLPGTEDAWRVALRAVETGNPFTAEARDLGRVTAEVHRVLAEHLPTAPTTPEDVDRRLTQMSARAAAAAAAVPALRARQQRIAGVLDAARDVPWPAMQRVHGDYHLGQVLHSARRGWVLVDFEGEPLRPLSERREPDQPLRDVAGMMRSFDYAGGSHEQARPGASARAWVNACQDAFLQGYADLAGTHPASLGALLTAFELDKALYEVVYEARNRPTWLSIPLTAVERLLDGDADADPPSRRTT